MTDEKVEFSERLQAAMDARGWTASDLHRAIVRYGMDVTYPTIKNWLDGRTVPDITVAPTLCAVLECPIESLIVTHTGPSPV